MYVYYGFDSALEALEQAIKRYSYMRYSYIHMYVSFKLLDVKLYHFYAHSHAYIHAHTWQYHTTQVVECVADVIQVMKLYHFYAYSLAYVCMCTQVVECVANVIQIMGREVVQSTPSSPFSRMVLLMQTGMRGRVLSTLEVCDVLCHLLF